MQPTEATEFLLHYLEDHFPGNVGSPRIDNGRFVVAVNVENEPRRVVCSFFALEKYPLGSFQDYVKNKLQLARQLSDHSVGVVDISDLESGPFRLS